MLHDKVTEQISELQINLGSGLVFFHVVDNYVFIVKTVEVKR